MGYPDDGLPVTEYFIDQDRRIYGPAGRTPWSLVGHAHAEAVWGRGGDTGYRLVGGCFFDPQGRQTSYFVADGSRRRDIHGPNAGLPWDTATEIEPLLETGTSPKPRKGAFA